jgi:hypothetical protein
MPLRFVVVMVLIIVLSGRAVAQDTVVVRGHLIDIETQQPVAGANVIVRGGKMGVMSDSTGYFRLELKAGQRQVLAFSHVAYRKETRELAPGTPKEVELQVSLTPEPIVMEEVVVHGSQNVVITKSAERRALYQFGGEEFEKLGEEDMERALAYFLPGVVSRLEVRMASSANDFTLYVDGEWKETLSLVEVDPFSVRRVLVWQAMGYEHDIDAFPIGMPLRRGKFVVSIETK